VQKIYLDNNATTQIDQRVLSLMLKDLSGFPANPSSIHWFGQQAKNQLLSARATVSSFFKARPEEILFTSGGTESLNIFLAGAGLKGHIITTAIEHFAIYKTIQSLEAEGLEVTYLPVGLWGAPTAEQVEKAIQSNTCAIILSAANGETGVKIDIEAIAAVAQKRGIPFFLDAIAYVGKEPLPHHRAITAIAISAHKFHGPKGVGALYLKEGCKLTPLFAGNQEGSRRGGTENLAGILGLAEAIDILQRNQVQITRSIKELRDRFEARLFKNLPDLIVNGEGPRICNVSNIAFLGADGETLLMQLDMAGIAASHGSACSSAALEPSRVLTNMGIDRKRARSSLRFSFGRMNTIEEIDLAVEKIVEIVTKIRKMSA
jgi:cysteine desulfurase